MEITAAVVRKAGAGFQLEICELGEPGPGEVRIKVEACGVCHTDVAARDQHMPVPLPAVLGHEGVGRIEMLGAGVTSFNVGDRVLASFGSCGLCVNCNDGAPGYCDLGLVYMLMGTRANGSSPITQGGAPLTGHFFAQSSMASYAVVSVNCLVKIDENIPAEIAAPLACGVQTGAGAVLLSMQAKAGKAIAIMGAGTVGLSAIMAAKIVGCSPIIAVDLMDSRLDMAKELGATHVLRGDTNALDEKILALGGSDYALDTTGVPAIAEIALNTLKKRGMLVCVGVGKPETSLMSVDMGMLMATGRQIRGVVEGDAIPKDFIPRLIEYYAEGLLPIDKIVTTYSFENINTAVNDSLSGKTIKPVLIM
ncbi:NAD(P)-dependent alcohol dehydrogenase [Zhongshania sp.]|uniref:NAD(P)-dependent alcohol dehydrogenase n=1 Tax=Zhongshania sp. TaxID=1971902 RepID=UPI002A838A2D|nr:NAD(P)-dependent alcohol dehydrogenase [Zhongshania sp.]